MLSSGWRSPARRPTNSVEKSDPWGGSVAQRDECFLELFKYSFILASREIHLSSLHFLYFFKYLIFVHNEMGVDL